MLTEYTYPGGRILLEDDNPTTPKKVALEYEARKVRWLMDNLKAGMTFVDVGAHHGYYTLLAAKLVGGLGLVVCFEPNPNNYRILGENISNNGYFWVIPHYIALGWDDGVETPLYLNERSGRSSFHRQNLDSVDVEIWMLDTIWQKNNHPSPDIIKIDTEGHEYQVVQGMEQTLKANPNCKVILEVHPQLNPESIKAVDLLTEWGIEIV